MGRQCDFSELVGKTLVSVTGLRSGSEEVGLMCSYGSAYRLWHEQDCCELVTVEYYEGEPADIIGAPVSMAEESSCGEDVGDGHETWTFYKLAARGYLTIRWWGQSSGYYSESVGFECVQEAAK